MIPKALKTTIISRWNETQQNPGPGYVVATRQLTGRLYQACRMMNLKEYKDILNAAIDQADSAITFLGGTNPDEASAIKICEAVLMELDPILFDDRLGLFVDDENGYKIGGI